jgi:hypothetical protein
LCGDKIVALESTFRELPIRLTRLQDVFAELQLTLVVDVPAEEKQALTGKYGDAVEACRGWLSEGLKAANEASFAVRHLGDLDRARRGLEVCQENVQRLRGCYSSDMASYERTRDLVQLGAERQGEWRLWATIARQGIERCREPLEEVDRALVRCWQEIAERVGANSVSVRTTSVGQKIIVPEAKRYVSEET